MQNMGLKPFFLLCLFGLCSPWRSSMQMKFNSLPSLPFSLSPGSAKRPSKVPPSKPFAVDQTIIADMASSRIKLIGERYAVSGDYVALQECGVGRYLGLRLVPMNPSKADSKTTKAAVVLFEDGELLVFERYANASLYFVRAGDGPEGGKKPSKVRQNTTDIKLGSLLDRERWQKKQRQAERKSLEIAVNVVNSLALRSTLYRAPCLPDDLSFLQFEANFSYAPTQDQQRCFEEIAADMVESTRPMERLVCGDVGFGKTEVAMRAAFRALRNNRQVAVLCPTTILAMQHAKTFRQRMPGVNIALLTSKSKRKASLFASLRSGGTQIAIGTQALFSQKVDFQGLGLWVIDEEQRFGVKQKEKLKRLAPLVDVLSLSATPIPRTLKMGLTGFRDLSLLSTAPVQRKEVEICLYSLPAQYFFLPYLIEQERRRGGQVFVVVPFKNLLRSTEKLLTDLLPGLKVVTVWGQQEGLEERVQSFREGDEHTVMLATSVIENGIDMPNVNTIIVLFVERFGISTLYQLRGRVGRGDRQASAHFFTFGAHSLPRTLKGEEGLINIVEQRLNAELKDRYSLSPAVLAERCKSTDGEVNKLYPLLRSPPGPIAVRSEQRLVYLQTFSQLGSGYDLACRDMELRGAGNLFGEEQSGAGWERDFGAELAQSIIARALEKLSDRLVLPVPDTSLSLDDALERDMGEERQGKGKGKGGLGALSLFEDLLLSRTLSLFGEEALEMRGQMRRLSTPEEVQDFSPALLSLAQRHNNKGEGEYAELLLLRMRMRLASRRLSLLSVERESEAASLSLNLKARYLSAEKLERLLEQVGEEGRQRRKKIRFFFGERDEDEEQVGGEGQRGGLNINLRYRSNSEDAPLPPYLEQLREAVSLLEELSGLAHEQILSSRDMLEQIEKEEEEKGKKNELEKAKEKANKKKMKEKERGFR